VRQIIGRSRQGRMLEGVVAGRGPLRVGLIAGCHGDEPVGPRWLSGFARALEEGHPLGEVATFRLVPEVNPDGAEANARWWRQGDGAGDLPGYLAHRVREAPGDDLEFGFPGAAEGDDGIRPEAAAVAAFLSSGGPVDLHGSLHGLGFGEGPWFLVEPAWENRLAPYHQACLEAAAREGLQPHDVDRHGEKGFRRLGVGLCTRPDSRAMRANFLERGDVATAARFRPSSMEFARSLGGDPFTFVTEVPLFLQPGAGAAVWSDRWGRWTLDLARASRQGRWDEAAARMAAEARSCGVVPLPLEAQLRLIGAQVQAAIDLVRAVRGA
jgi:hypothetical protein